MRHLLVILSAFVLGIGRMVAEPQPQSVKKGDLILVQHVGDIVYQLDSVLTQSVESSSWQASNKMSYAYDSNYQLIASRQQRQNNGWVNVWQDYYQISENGVREMRLEQKWNNESSNWVNTRKRDYNDNTPNGALDIVYSEWSEDQAWNKIWQQTQDYDADGKLLAYETTKSVSGTSQMEPYWDYNCYYNEEGLMQQTSHRSYSTDNQVWDDAFECIKEFQNGQLVSEHVIDWNAQTASWDNLQFTEVSYPDYNRIIKVKKVWNTENNNWQISSRITEVYDNNDEVIESFSEYWDQSLNAWQPRQLDVVDYDGNGLKKFKVISYWNATNSSFEEYSKDVYYYSEQIPTDIEKDPISNGLIVYPNPVDSEMILKFDGRASRLMIYSIDGAKVLDQMVPITGQAINVGHLKSGIYIAMVEIDGQYMESKFIKN